MSCFGDGPIQTKLASEANYSGEFPLLALSAIRRDAPFLSAIGPKRTKPNFAPGRFVGF
jgi:hypothetical protein